MSAMYVGLGVLILRSPSRRRRQTEYVCRLQCFNVGRPCRATHAMAVPSPPTRNGLYGFTPLPAFRPALIGRCFITHNTAWHDDDYSIQSPRRRCRAKESRHAATVLAFEEYMIMNTDICRQILKYYKVTTTNRAAIFTALAHSRPSPVGRCRCTDALLIISTRSWPNSLAGAPTRALSAGRRLANEDEDFSPYVNSRSFTFAAICRPRQRAA